MEKTLEQVLQHAEDTFPTWSACQYGREGTPEEKQRYREQFIWNYLNGPSYNTYPNMSGCIKDLEARLKEMIEAVRRNVRLLDKLRNCGNCNHKGCCSETECSDFSEWEYKDD